MTRDVNETIAQMCGLLPVTVMNNEGKSLSCAKSDDFQSRTVLLSMTLSSSMIVFDILYK